MRWFKLLFWLFPALLVGCTTSEIVNLTPTQEMQTATGLYRFEAAWKTDQRSIRPGSLKGNVVIGLKSYPMQRTPLVADRWETFIPLGTNESVIHYRYKFDYLYNSIPQPKPDSKLSREYDLRILRQ